MKTSKFTEEQIAFTLSLRYRRFCFTTNVPEIVPGVGHFSVIICPSGGSVLGYHNQQVIICEHYGSKESK